MLQVADHSLSDLLAFLLIIRLFVLLHEFVACLLVDVDVDVLALTDDVGFNLMELIQLQRRQSDALIFHVILAHYLKVLL